jgi:hypothetical protein
MGLGLMGPAGMAGPMQPAGRMPSPPPMPGPPPSMLPPGMARGPAPGNVDSRTIISSPLADQLSGPMMQQQALAQESKLIHTVVIPIIQKIANRKQDVDPKGSAELFAMLGKLVKAVPPVSPPPMTPGGMTQAAGALPQPGGPPQMGGGPPPPAGPAGPPLSGPMSGM